MRYLLCMHTCFSFEICLIYSLFIYTARNTTQYFRGSILILSRLYIKNTLGILFRNWNRIFTFDITKIHCPSDWLNNLNLKKNCIKYIVLKLNKCFYKLIINFNFLTQLFKRIIFYFLKWSACPVLGSIPKQIRIYSKKYAQYGCDVLVAYESNTLK